MKIINDQQYKVMQHYASGSEVEVFVKELNKWVRTPLPSWDWVKYDYRIKEDKLDISIEKENKLDISIAKDNIKRSRSCLTKNINSILDKIDKL